MKITEELSAAARDYRLFLERGYPDSTLKKVVGDRHRLSGEERLILFRGVATSALDRSRSEKRLPPKAVAERTLLIDFYNVAFTLLNYRLGRPLFRSTDSFVRDAGALHGRLGKDERLEWVLPPLMDTLAHHTPRSVRFFLDAPVSHSAAHAARVEVAGEECSFPVSANLVPSADHPLKRRAPGELIATGDSAVIDAVPEGVIDLSSAVLKEAFDFDPPDLRRLI